MSSAHYQQWTASKFVMKENFMCTSMILACFPALFCCLTFHHQVLNTLFPPSHTERTAVVSHLNAMHLGCVIPSCSQWTITFQRITEFLNSGVQYKGTRGKITTVIGVFCLLSYVLLCELCEDFPSCASLTHLSAGPYTKCAWFGLGPYYFHAPHYSTLLRCSCPLEGSKIAVK